MRDFYPQHPVPAPAVRTGGHGPRDLLVLSIDATGINMIDSGLREAPARTGGPQPPSAQLACRERTGRTRMAVVTACYDAAPAVRGPGRCSCGEYSRRRPTSRSRTEVILKVSHCFPDTAGHRVEQQTRVDPGAGRAGVAADLRESGPSVDSGAAVASSSEGVLGAGCQVVAAQGEWLLWRPVALVWSGGGGSVSGLVSG